MSTSATVPSQAASSSSRKDSSTPATATSAGSSGRITGREGRVGIEPRGGAAPPGSRSGRREPARRPARSGRRDAPAVAYPRSGISHSPPVSRSLAPGDRRRTFVHQPQHGLALLVEQAAGDRRCPRSAPPAAARARPSTGSRRGRNSSGRPASSRGQPSVSGPAVTVAPSALLSSKIAASPSALAVAVSDRPARYSRQSTLSSQIRRVVDRSAHGHRVGARERARAAGTADGSGLPQKCPSPGPPTRAPPLPPPTSAKCAAPRPAHPRSTRAVG